MSELTNNTVVVENFEFDDLSGDGHFIEEPNGYRNYGPMVVNKNGGALISKGLFSAVEVYCEPTSWLPGTWEGWKTDHKVFTPIGLLLGEKPNNNVGVPADYVYPNANRLGVVLIQRNDDSLNSEVNYQQITAISADDPQRIILNGQKNIYVAVNDQRVNEKNNYALNSSSFRIHVKLIP